MLAACAALRDPIPAVVISPLLPEPPVTGGQKRTLRLLEAMERAGLRAAHPDRRRRASPGAAERLRSARLGRSTSCPSRAHGPARTASASTRQRLPSPFLRELAGALRRGSPPDAALVQFEHTQSAYYAAPARRVRPC